MQADKERAERQREYLAQLERENANSCSFDSSGEEANSITNSSTQEGEMTIQRDRDDEEEEEEDDR